MTTRESWLNDSTILVEWFPRLTVDELKNCFRNVAQEIDNSAHAVDVVIDISNAGYIPSDLPNLAVRSGFLGKLETRDVVVVGKNHWAEILANAASRAACKPIVFFRSYDEAAQALHWAETSV